MLLPMQLGAKVIIQNYIHVILPVSKTSFPTQTDSIPVPLAFLPSVKFLPETHRECSVVSELRAWQPPAQSAKLPGKGDSSKWDSSHDLTGHNIHKEVVLPHYLLISAVSEEEMSAFGLFVLMDTTLILLRCIQVFAEDARASAQTHTQQGYVPNSVI